MPRRSFSLMLAWRYLNPRRAMLSTVTIISVTGVLLGVWILVVVMSVYNGMEKQMKERLLGFTPHIRLEYAPFGAPEPIEGWREVADALAAMPEVESATAFVQDYVWLDSGIRRRFGIFRAIDTENPEQIAGIERMLARTEHPGSHADMGLDDRIVISSVLAGQMGLTAGDPLSLYSLKNLEEAARVAEKTRVPPVRELMRGPLDEVRGMLGGEWESREGRRYLPGDIYDSLYNKLYDAFQEHRDDIRDAEAEILYEYFEPLDEAEETAGGFLLAEGSRETMLGALGKLEETDVKEMDSGLMDNMSELVLPKEALVTGVYQASQMMVMPDLFMPLPLAQELAGMQGGVQGIAVRLENPDRAGPLASGMLAALPPGWYASTWATEFGYFATIINQQRIMMYLVLGMIIVISAFSMMAVMFTVTIQKRREIGVLKALGAAPGQIVRVFVYQGMILGVAGAVSGVLFGLVTLRFRGHLQDVLRKLRFDPFPADFSGFEVMPAEIVPQEVALIAACAFLLSSLAAFIPAFAAARSDAAKSLRNL